jgi:hypothetical protein
LPLGGRTVKMKSAQSCSERKIDFLRHSLAAIEVTCGACIIGTRFNFIISLQGLDLHVAHAQS